MNLLRRNTALVACEDLQLCYVFHKRHQARILISAVCYVHFNNCIWGHKTAQLFPPYISSSMTNWWSVRVRPVCRAPVIFACRKWKLSRPWMGKVFLKWHSTLSACIYQFVTKANAKQKVTLFVGQSVYIHSVRRTDTKESRVIYHYPIERFFFFLFFQCCAQ